LPFKIETTSIFSPGTKPNEAIFSLAGVFPQTLNTLYAVFARAKDKGSIFISKTVRTD
jgi:hypothetical protein